VVTFALPCWPGIPMPLNTREGVAQAPIAPGARCFLWLPWLAPWPLKLWRFITPGLHPREKRYAIPFVLTSIVLFAAGCSEAEGGPPGAVGTRPPEYAAVNLEELHAISYTKGCYTGQEVVARLHYKAKLKSALYRFALPLPETGELPRPGEEVPGIGPLVMSALIAEGRAEALIVARHDSAQTRHLPLPYPIPVPGEEP
jgi:hypothetical protein